MSTKVTSSNGYPSVSWADTLEVQRSALRWDVKRAMKSLCSKLEEIGEECFLVTVNISNGWVGHLGTVRGDEYIDEKSHILYDFLNYCGESIDNSDEDNAKSESRDARSDSDMDLGETSDKASSKQHKPIQISTPDPLHSDNIYQLKDQASVDGDHDQPEDRVIVEIPEKYRKPEKDVVKSVTPQVKEVFVKKPVKIPVLIDMPFIPKSLIKQLQQTPQPQQGDETLLSRENRSEADDPQRGTKRKRKQTFEEIVPKESSRTPDRRHSSQTTPEQPDGGASHPDLLDTGSSDTHQPVPDSSTRILRSTGKNKDEEKVVKMSQKGKEDKDSDDEDEEYANDDDYIVDDVDDEDWIEEDDGLDYLKSKIKRDTFGRFVVTNRLGAKKKKRVPEDVITNKKTDKGLEAGGSKQVADGLQIESGTEIHEEFQSGGNVDIPVGIRKDADEEFQKRGIRETNEELLIGSIIETNDTLQLVDIIETNEDIHIGVSKETVEELQAESSKETHNELLIGDSKENVEEFRARDSQDTNKDFQVGGDSDVLEEFLSEGNKDTNEECQIGDSKETNQ